MNREAISGNTSDVSYVAARFIVSVSVCLVYNPSNGLALY